MFLNKWRQRGLFRSGRRWLQVQGRWGVNDDTLEYLLEQLGRVEWTGLDLGQLETRVVSMRNPNIDQLILGILDTQLRLSRGEPVHSPVATYSVPQPMTLEEYLVTQNRYPVTPTQAVSKLTQTFTAMVTGLRILHSEEDPREGHYRRHLDGAWQDLYTLLNALAALARL